MDDLIKEALEEYFSDFKQYHLIILIGFTIVIALLQIIQSYRVSRKLEKFKNDLKKSEIRFSKYNQLQTEALNIIYPLLAELLVNTVVIQTDIKGASPEKIAKMAENWGDSFNKVFEKHLTLKYILTKNIKEKYSKLTKQLLKVNSYIKVEKEFSSLFATLENGQVEFMGDFDERIKLSEELDKLKSDGLISDTVNAITDLQAEIEDYFEKME